MYMFCFFFFFFFQVGAHSLSLNHHSPRTTRQPRHYHTRFLYFEISIVDLAGRTLHLF